MTVKLDLPPIRRGDDYAHSLRMRAPDKVTPVDVSDRTFAARLRYVRGGTAADFTVDTTNAVTGIIVLRLTHEQTAALNLKLAEWDLQQTHAGAITTPLSGRVPIEEDITP